MKHRVSLLIAAGSVAYAIGFFPAHAAAGDSQDTRGKVCRMEQQCHWENFKKICTWVKVCR
jgi:hypothetical protein